jgi:uncharacterized membrane protein (DUF106 family)
MTLVNRLLDRVFELLIRPLGSLPILGSLAIVSLVTAIAILLVMRATSNQQALASTERQMYADLLEMRLFKDDLSAMWRAQLSMFRHNAGYLRLSLAPALWTLVPVVLAVAQLQCYFGFSGVGVREPVLVTATLKSRGEFQNIALDLPPGTRLDTPAIWFPALQQVVWRVVAESTGEYVLGLRAGGMVYGKTLQVSNGLVRRSPVRPGAQLIDEVLYPSEAPLPDSGPFASIRVAYPDRHIDVFGAQMPWFDVYIVLSVVFALALRRPLAGIVPYRRRRRGGVLQTSSVRTISPAK